MSDMSMNNSGDSSREPTIPVASLRAKRRRKLMKNQGEGRRRNNKANGFEEYSGKPRKPDNLAQNSGNIEQLNPNLEIPTLVTLDPESPKFGAASTCGRRRDMEDAIAIHPYLSRAADNRSTDIHYFGVYDGHGCSHVATRCKEFMHELVKEELYKVCWVEDMKRSFKRMDEEATKTSTNYSSNNDASCRCQLKTPLSTSVGSAVIVTMLTPSKIIVSHCGDCRAVLSRDGRPFPLSIDHKPDRPDELQRIQSFGGHVISWYGTRVEGVLAMSRAIGDPFLKPLVNCEPEVMVFDRNGDDDCLILASDGLWDVISNETACGIVKMCFRIEEGERKTVRKGGETYDQACYKAAALLTLLAIARESTDNISVVVVDLRKN